MDIEQKNEMMDISIQIQKSFKRSILLTQTFISIMETPKIKLCVLAKIIGKSRAQTYLLCDYLETLRLIGRPNGKCIYFVNPSLSENEKKQYFEMAKLSRDKVSL